MAGKSDVFKGLLSKEKPAALWKRVAAYFIDIVLVTYVILSPLTKGIDVKGDSVGEFYSTLSNNPELAKNFIIVMFLSSLLIVLYWTILDYANGASVGKMLMRLKVISKNKKMTFSQSFVRNITKMSSTLLLLDGLYMIFKKTNLRYFEAFTNTEVVETWGK
jgi:uncharacterized RDD family membrane protein YckC